MYILHNVILYGAYHQIQEYMMLRNRFSQNGPCQDQQNPEHSQAIRNCYNRQDTYNTHLAIRSQSQVTLTPSPII